MKFAAKTAAAVIIAIYLVVNPLAAHAGENDFYALIDEALQRHAAREKLDLASADPRAFGLQVEKHGNQARIGIFDLSKQGEVQTHLFGCQHEQVATCWFQKTTPTTPYAEGSAKYSAALQLSAVFETLELLEKKNIDPANFALLKVWQSSNLIHLRVGYEAGVVEINYDCDPTKQKMCRPAAAFPEGEP